MNDQSNNQFFQLTSLPHPAWAETATCRVRCMRAGLTQEGQIITALPQAVKK